MKFHATAIDGVLVAGTEPVADGSAAIFRTQAICARLSFAAAGLDFDPVQMNISR